MASEFGKGLTYCLGLFLAHYERYKYDNRMYETLGDKDMLKTVPTLWFNGASDHLYDLQIPDKLPESIQKRLSALQIKAIDLGHIDVRRDCCFDKATEADVFSCIDEAKHLLLEIDKFFGVEAEKGDYE